MEQIDSVIRNQVLACGTSAKLRRKLWRGTSKESNGNRHDPLNSHRIAQIEYVVKKKSRKGLLSLERTFSARKFFSEMAG